MNHSQILDIYAKLFAIVRNDKNKTIKEQGDLIIKATIGRSDIDSFYEHYPILQDIAELGTEMASQPDEPYIAQCLARIKLYLPVLNGQINELSL